ncbi:MAG: PspC domain-containing protein [Planctomycetota bacterium]|nr:MAG: PspC domain-containing protein [Planctomycetota bacterium]
MSGAGNQPRLLRPRDGRIVLGVCAGLARGIGTDATVVRGLFAVPLAIGLLGAFWFHFHAHLCACNPYWLLETSEWLCWLGGAVLLVYLLASALIPNE